MNLQQKRDNETPVAKRWWQNVPAVKRPSGETAATKRPRPPITWLHKRWVRQYENQQKQEKS